MVGPPPAVAAVRVAVRRWLATHQGDRSIISVAVSGGADSLALCSALLFEARGSFDVHGITIDHGLQPDSTDRAAAVREQMLQLGCASAVAVRVDVGARGGLEAAARHARYAGLQEHRRGEVLLGHTLDDQAESVLLGLGRGSGRRSLQGMAPYAPPWGRPLLSIRRAQTLQYCDDLALPVWHDPHNDDPRFTRVRLRAEALPLLEDILGGGVAPALARTADQLRAADPSHDVAALLELVGGVLLDARSLARFTEGTRRVLIKRWLDDRLAVADDSPRPDSPTTGSCSVDSIPADSGSADCAVTAAHVIAIDALVARYHGQGPVYLPGGSRAIRERGKIVHAPADDRGRAAPRRI
ncbi:MAG: tRNA lysidine(34) synthetase TilS [Cumulibacter sp.]